MHPWHGFRAIDNSEFVGIVAKLSEGKLLSCTLLLQPSLLVEWDRNSEIALFNIAKIKQWILILKSSDVNGMLVLEDCIFKFNKLCFEQYR